MSAEHAGRDGLPEDRMLDCVVVGGGPAGLTAALYLRRFLRSVRLVDAGAGRARRISRSNNVAGFPDGIAGPRLLARMTQHLQQVGGAVMPGTVDALQIRPDGSFELAVGAQSLLARTVILCTGVRDRLPAVTGAAEVEAAGLLRYCPVCDGYEHRGGRIGVIGNSAHGVREAAFLLNFSPDVGFIGMGGASERLQPELRKAGLTALPGELAQLAVGSEGEVDVRMDDGRSHRFHALYAALGVDPCTALAARLGARLDDVGNIVVDAHGRTGVAGLYAAGDVVQALDQIGVAVGQAAIAATAVHNSL